MGVSNVSSVTSTPSSNVSDHTLQAAIELVYVQVANDILVQQMGSLESALGITQNVSNILATIQNLHNDVQVASTGTFNFNYTSATSLSAYEKAYTSAASAYFGGPVTISASFPSGYASFQSQFLTAKAQLSAEIPVLSAVTASGGNPNSLLETIKTVLTDMNAALANGSAHMESGIINWLIDKYNTPNAAGGNSAGQIQQDITNALTAAENLNTTQTESVRSYLFLFEEYYKSASAIISQMTQIIQKMADGIAH